MIIFDPPQVYDVRYGRTCHLLSDQVGPAGTDELLAFGRRIGMQKRWLQKGGTPDEHFDLFQSRVARAVDAGAVKVSRFRIHEVLVAKRRSLSMGHTEGGIKTSESWRPSPNPSPDEIPMDDPAVREILSDLDGVITQRHREAFERSIAIRCLTVWWEGLFENAHQRRHPCKDPNLRLCKLPPVGARWCDWIETLLPHGLGEVASAMLSEAGVLGTQWSLGARSAAWRAKGWS